MEKVKDEHKTIEEYKSEIINLIENICSCEYIENLKEENTQTWLYILKRINKEIFSNKKELKINIFIPSNSKYNYTTNNAYNTLLLAELCEYMIMLGHKYNKPYNINCFSLTFGIYKDTIYKWQYYKKDNNISDLDMFNIFNYIDKDTYIYNSIIDDIDILNEYKVILNIKGLEIWQMLTDNNESALRSKLMDSKQPLAQITLLNHDHGYNMPSATNGTGTQNRLSIDNLPSLSVSGEHAQTLPGGQPTANTAQSLV